MHSHAKRVVAAVRSGQAAKKGRYLRVMPGASLNLIRSYLQEERSTAEKEVAGRGSSALTNCTTAMQTLILTELLLSKPSEPVNIDAICAAQGNDRYVVQSLEQAVELLKIMGPRLLETGTWS